MEKDKILTDADYGSCKRGLEYFAADPAWREEFLADPAKALAIFPDISDVYAAFKAIGMMRHAIPGDRENPYYGEYLRRFIARFAHDKLPNDVPIRLEPAVTVEEQERYLLLRGDGTELRLSGNLHLRTAVRRLSEVAVTLPELWRELGIGFLLGEDVRRKLELLYRKGYLRLF